MSRPVALVTGAARGIGLATTDLFIEEGWHVAMIDIDAAELTKAAQPREHVTAIECDVSDPKAAKEAIVRVVNELGGINALVNNAGTTRFVDHADLDGLNAEDFQRIYAVNTVGAFQMSRAVAPAMRSEGEGAIFNVASIAAITGVGSSIAYAASKGAMVTMTLSLARVLGPEIRVNAVLPGFIQGDWLAEGMGAERYERTRAHLEANAPLRLTVDADTVAESILYFVTGASVITGETLIVDGGHHLMQTTLARR